MSQSFKILSLNDTRTLSFLSLYKYVTDNNILSKLENVPTLNRWNGDLFVFSRSRKNLLEENLFWTNGRDGTININQNKILHILFKKNNNNNSTNPGTLVSWFSFIAYFFAWIFCYFIFLLNPNFFIFS